MLGRLDARLLAPGAVLLVLWLLVLRPTPLTWDDHGASVDGLPWNTVVRSPRTTDVEGTDAVSAGCGHGRCPVLLRSHDAPSVLMHGLYWRSPWASDETRSVPPAPDDGDGWDGGDRYLSVATYHERGFALDLSWLAAAYLLLRLGIGGARAVPAAVTTVALSPLWIFYGFSRVFFAGPLVVAGVWVLVGEPLFLFFTNHPRVRGVGQGLLETALLVIPLAWAMAPYAAVGPFD